MKKNKLIIFNTIITIVIVLLYFRNSTLDKNIEPNEIDVYSKAIEYAKNEFDFKNGKFIDYYYNIDIVEKDGNIYTINSKFYPSNSWESIDFEIILKNHKKLFKRWELISAKKIEKKNLEYKIKNVKVNNEFEKGKEFFENILDSNVENIKQLIENGVDINGKDIYGKTPLMTALGIGNLEITNLLIKNGADLNILDIEDINTLEYAFLSNNNNILKLLIENGINYTEKQGTKFLINAITTQDKDIIDFLLKKDISLNLIVNYRTPLIEAVSRNDVETIKKLIKLGADINYKNNEGNTAIIYTENFEILETLINLNADINVRDGYGVPLLTMILKNWQSNSEIIKAINYLTKLGVNVDASDNNGENIFEEYIADRNLNLNNEENKKILKLLLKYSNQKNEILIQAVEHKKLELIKCLIESGADVNVLTHESDSLLLKATIRNNWYNRNFANEVNLEMAKLLLNANIKIREFEKKDLIYYAVSQENIELVRLLIKNGCNILEEALWEATSDRSEEIVRILIEAGVNVNTKDEYGKTPLVYMFTRGNDNENIATMLIDAGSEQLDQALYYAVAYEDFCNMENTNIIKKLIDAGADVNYEIKGKTIFREAIKNEDYVVVKILIEAGVDIRMKGSSKKDILEYINYLKSKKTDNIELEKIYEYVKKRY